MDTQPYLRTVLARRRSVQLVLLGPHGEVGGDVLDLSVRACGAVFTKEALSGCGVGDQVEIEFRSVLLLDPMRLGATIRRVGELQGRLLVALEFHDPDWLTGRIPFVLANEFDRRLQSRAVLDEEVAVRVVTLELEDKAMLLDVSSGGLRLGLGVRLAFRVHSSDLLELHFELPGCSREFWIFGEVCDVRLADNSVSCSVNFDTQTTLDFERQRTELEGFVARRRKLPRILKQPRGAA